MKIRTLGLFIASALLLAGCQSAPYPDSVSRGFLYEVKGSQSPNSVWLMAGLPQTLEGDNPLPAGFQQISAQANTFWSEWDLEREYKTFPISSDNVQKFSREVGELLAGYLLNTSRTGENLYHDENILHLKSGTFQEHLTPEAKKLHALLFSDILYLKAFNALSADIEKKARISTPLSPEGFAFTIEITSFYERLVCRLEVQNAAQKYFYWGTSHAFSNWAHQQHKKLNGTDSVFKSLSRKYNFTDKTLAERYHKAFATGVLLKETDRQYLNLVKAWYAGDAERVVDVKSRIKAHLPQDPEVQSLYKAMYIDNPLDTAQSIRGCFTEKDQRCLVAVDTLQLMGADGLLEHYKKQGYTVTRFAAQSPR